MTRIGASKQFGSFADGVLELRAPKSSHGSKPCSAQAVAREPEEVVQ